MHNLLIFLSLLLSGYSYADVLDQPPPPAESSEQASAGFDRAVHSRFARAAQLDERAMGSASHGFTAEPLCLDEDELQTWLPMTTEYAAMVLSRMAMADEATFERLQLVGPARVWLERLATPTALELLASSVTISQELAETPLVASAESGSPLVWSWPYVMGSLDSRQCVTADLAVLLTLEAGLSRQAWIGMELSPEDRRALAEMYLEIYLNTREQTGPGRPDQDPSQTDNDVAVDSYRLCAIALPGVEELEDCASEIFYTSHTDTYYGSAIYLASDAATKANLLQILTTQEASIGEFLVDDYQQLINSAESLVLAVDQMDMPYYHLYTIDTDRYSNDKVQVVLRVAFDWFTEDPGLLGFSAAHLLHDYNY